MKIHLNYFNNLRTHRRTSFIILFLILGLFPTYATNYYVDKNANGSNNGSSWNNAWESFSAINWNTVNPGDTVFVSGGIISQRYIETLNIPSSVAGTASQPIVITKGKTSGHNGEVIIGDGYVIGNGIAIDGSYYVKVSGFTIKRTNGPGIEATGTVNVLWIEDMVIYRCDDRGIRLYGGSTSTNRMDSVTVSNCTITLDSTKTVIYM